MRELTETPNAQPCALEYTSSHRPHLRSNAHHQDDETPMKNWMRTLSMLLLGLAFTVSGVSEANAQSDGEAEIATEEGDVDELWAENRTVRVIQRRLYPTDGEFQLTLFMGMIPNDPFANYYPVGLRLGYWLSESVAIELSGSYIGDALSAETDLTEFLTSVDVDAFAQDQQRWRAGGAVLWSPLYGKFSFLGNKLAHFDWYIGAGVGVVGTENPSSDALGVETANTFAPEVTILTGWNLHLHQRWALRLDYRQGIFTSEGGGAAFPSELSLGASYFF
ncbi:MAG: outer membrane beta-barrel protein [Bradymonadia bacterium]|jgi:outer membrane beta-barrel protein